MYLLVECALCLASGAGALAAPMSVRVDSEKSEYVLGEAVLLDVIVTNVTDGDIDVWVDILRWQQIQVFVASGEDDFQQFMGVRRGYDVFPEMEPLKPGDSKSYGFRVLYTPDSIRETRKPWHLAFEKPGPYRVKARYQRRDYSTVESDAIQLQIKEPEWLDARLWEEINSPELLYFLQESGVRYEDRRHEHRIVYKAFELYQRPRSSYHPALKYALRNVYEGHRLKMSKELSRLRRWHMILGIEEPLPELPRESKLFLDDRRLDIRVTYHFPEPTQLEDVFNEISEQTAVPLRVAPALAIHRMKGGTKDRKITLRDFMDARDGHGAAWLREGDAYKLVPAPEEK